MKIFLTGATGFLGHHIANELAASGHQIVALVRKTSNRKHLNGLPIEFIEGSLPQAGPLAKIISQCEVIIHGAGVVKALSKNDFFRVNAKGTEHLVAETLLADQCPRRFIYISSLAVHNPTENENFCLAPEKCHPLSHYGNSKLAGELALKRLPETITKITLRPPALFGPHDFEFLPLFRAIKRGFAPLYQNGQNRLSLCYGPEVAKAVVQLAESEKIVNDSVFCIDDGAHYSWIELSQAIGEIVNKKPKYLKLPKIAFIISALASQAWAQTRRKPEILSLNKINEIKQKSWVCGHKKLSEAIAWRPQVTLQEALQKTYDFYRDAKLI